MKKKIKILLLAVCMLTAGIAFSCSKSVDLGETEESVAAIEESTKESAKASEEESSEAVRAAPKETEAETAGAEVATEGDGKVNINTAGAAELKTLNGIGDKRAADIVSYRDSHGTFSCIEDIMKVPGIKDGIFSKIKEDIKV